MVDLVKIRKKKAKEKEQPQQQAETEPVREQAAAPEAAAPEAAAPARAAKAAPAQAPPEPQQTRAGNKLERFKADAGKRREVESAQVEESGTDQIELLTFAIAGEHYAVDIERIVEIVTPRSVTRIPNADQSVVGIMSLRGTIVTLVDVRRKLRHDAAGEATEDTRIVVIDFHHEIVGFLVDRVLRVVKTARTAIEPHPVVHATELDESIRGVFRTGGALTILLDLDKLLDHRALAAGTA